jgi:hypothetical protein
MNKNKKRVGMAGITHVKKNSHYTPWLEQHDVQAERIVQLI